VCIFTLDVVLVWTRLTIVRNNSSNSETGDYLYCSITDTKLLHFCDTSYMAHVTNISKLIAG